MQAIQFEDFSYHYPKTGTGLDRVSLSIPYGSFTVLTGANGGGKTTLCLAMTGLVPHFLAPLGTERRWFQADNLHPVAAAQPLLAEQVLKALDALPPR